MATSEDTMVVAILRWAEDMGYAVSFPGAEELAKRLAALGATRQPWTRWTDGMKEELRQRRDRGETAGEIAKAMGMTHGKVNGALSRLAKGEL